MRVELDGGYVITDDPAVVDRDRLFVWLRDDAYWWEGGLHRDVFEQAIDNSLAASALGPDAEFVGFARLVTDRASFARRGFATLPNPAIFMQIDRPDAARDGFTTP